MKNVLRTANSALVVTGLVIAAYGIYELTTDLLEAANEKLDKWLEEKD
jgi:hypothetical protein